MSARQRHAEHPEHPAGYPVTINDDWNLITRTILPLIWQPGFAPGQGSTFGLGDLQLSGFLSPSRPGDDGLIWGVGAITQMPTDTRQLGNGNWGLGPTAVVLKVGKGQSVGIWRAVNNVWSLSSDRRGGWLQQLPDPALRQLQLPRRNVYITPRRSSRQTGRRRAASDGRCRSASASGKHLSHRQAARQRPDRRVRERDPPRSGGRLATAAQVQLMFPK